MKIKISDVNYDLDFDEAIRLGVLKNPHPNIKRGTLVQDTDSVYARGEGPIYIVVVVEGNGVLINLESGGYYTRPVPVLNHNLITEKEWKEICDGEPQLFKVVKG
jgi:hypothetical protein